MDYFLLLLFIITLFNFKDLSNFIGYALLLILVFLFWLLSGDYSYFWNLSLGNMKSFLGVLTIFSFLMVYNVIDDYSFEMYFLTFITLLASMLMILTDNLLTMYFLLEMQTFSFFILIAKNSESIKGSEASLKYFILGAISSGIFLFALSLIFFFSSSVNVNEMNILSNTEMIWFSLLLIFLSLAFKLAMFPFQFWIPDIYEGSSWSMITLISTFPKISIMSIMMKIMNFSDFLIFISLLSIAMGSIGALNQTKLKSLMAFSGVSHIGFVTLIFSLANFNSIEVGLTYLVIYILSLLSVFVLVKKTIFSKNYFIIELGGLNFLNKLIPMSWLMMIMSIAGIPPFSGFLAKWILLTSLMGYGYNFCALVCMIFSIISAGFYLSMVKICYFQEKSSYMIWENCLKSNYYHISLKEYMLGFIVFISISLIVYPVIISKNMYLISMTPL